jgi:hypothetical protein
MSIVALSGMTSVSTELLGFWKSIQWVNDRAQPRNSKVLKPMIGTYSVTFRVKILVRALRA